MHACSMVQMQMVHEHICMGRPMHGHGSCCVWLAPPPSAVARACIHIYYDAIDMDVDDVYILIRRSQYDSEVCHRATPLGIWISLLTYEYIMRACMNCVWLWYCLVPLYGCRPDLAWTTLFVGDRSIETHGRNRAHYSRS
jgi:hypothetical protein